MSPIVADYAEVERSLGRNARTADYDYDRCNGGKWLRYRLKILADVVSEILLVAGMSEHEFMLA